jgi:hypothetical protein
VRGDWFDHLEQLRREKDRRDAIPERPCHLPWLHGEVVPAISPRQAAERNGGVVSPRQWWKT